LYLDDIPTTWDDHFIMKIFEETIEEGGTNFFYPSTSFVDVLQNI
jgi:hypothetical protein